VELLTLKMKSITKAVILLFSVVCIASGLKLRSEEHVKNRERLLEYLDKMEDTIVQDIRNYTTTGHRTKLFEEWVKMAKMDKEFFNVETEDLEPEQAVIGCAACRTVVAAMMFDRRNNGAHQDDLADTAVNLCGVLTDFSPPVCRGTIDMFTESVVYIVDSRPSLTATQMCSFVLQGECGGPDPVFNFEINVSPGPPVTQSKSVSAPRSPDELVIIHFTDIHIDENYLVNGWGNCGNPVCCRRNDGMPSNPADAAGFWGDFRDCNTPFHTVENMMRQIRAQHPHIDAIYHTGDIMDHGIWEKTEASVRRVTSQLYDMMSNVFGNVPVFSAIGNHEVYPVNLFAPTTIVRPTLSTRWLYELSASTYQRHGWITDPAALNTIRQGGFYTVLLRPGFRIISINNNDCYTYNFWVMYDRTEIQANLQWLNNVLFAAEQNNERVHILGHVHPNGGGCLQFWAREFRRIMDRFHMIIGGQFNGHSHNDQFAVYYDRPSVNHAINVAWNAGAATPKSQHNPNYLVYFVDRVHYQVNEAESWIFSLAEANRTPAIPPRWFRLYQFRQDFGLPDLSPATLDRFAFDLSRNRNILRRYWEFKNRVLPGDPRWHSGCNDDCLRNQVCSIVRNEFDDLRKCNQVLAVFGTVV
jgi:sphingomyelin phosphodiesterase